MEQQKHDAEDQGRDGGEDGGQSGGHDEDASALFEALEPVERRYLVANNNCKLLYRRYRRRNLVSKCTVLLVHGFGEHVGRFPHVIQMLMDSGCDVHTMDLRGHGLSGGARADGYFADFIDDISLLHRVAELASPTLPVFLYGQSMGGMLVMAFAIRRARLSRCNIRGVIATSPWFRLANAVQPPWWKCMMLELAAPILQEFLVSSNVDPCSLSTVEHVVNAAINDRLVLPFMTVRMAQQIISGAHDTLAMAEQMQVPFLLCHAANDSLTDATASLEFGKRASAKDKTVRIYRANCHEIHNDNDREQLFGEVCAWLDHRCTPMTPEPAASRLSRLHHHRRILSRLVRRLASLLLLLLLGVMFVGRKRSLRRIAWMQPLQWLQSFRSKLLR